MKNLSEDIQAEKYVRDEMESLESEGILHNNISYHEAIHCLYYQKMNKILLSLQVRIPEDIFADCSVVLGDHCLEKMECHVEKKNDYIALFFYTRT